MVRTGIVLAPGAGVIAKLAPIFKFGPGTPVGGGGKFLAQGNQWMSWIHIDDIVGIFRLAIENGGAEGPMNGTAPEPVRNADFARTFSSILRTKYTPWRVFVPVGPPDALLRLMVGEVAGVVTTGQRAVPKKALALGYSFKYPHLAEALKAIVEHVPAPKPAEPEHHAAGTGHH
jgi:NAD dependent epimerase/dehydratase family enzyme